MNPYYNLPPQQHAAQLFADLFNSDEAVWHSLRQRRRPRRKLLKMLKKKQHKALDLMEFTVVRPSDDCIAHSWQDALRK